MKVHLVVLIHLLVKNKALEDLYMVKENLEYFAIHL